MTYIRLVTPDRDEDSRQPRGLFSAAYELLHSGELEADDWRRLRDDVDWFVANLPAPKKAPHKRAIFWFRSSADECVRRAWEMVQLLRLHGHQIEMVKCSDPGRIVFHDDFQVAALPQVKRRR
jgi:hypothetical protein